MQLFSAPSIDKRSEADLCLLPYFVTGSKISPGYKKSDLPLSVGRLVEEDFRAASGELLFSYDQTLEEKRALFVGLGPKKACTPTSVAKAYAEAFSLCKKKKISRVNVMIPETFSPELCEAVVEAFLQSNYSFDALKRQSLDKHPTFLIEEITFVGVDKKFVSMMEQKKLVSLGVNLTRDLVNGNADDVTPSYLAQLAKDLAKKYGSLQVKVLRQKELEKQNMNLMLAVNQGSAKDPALIVMQYTGNPKSDDVTAVVGKGVTYDTGGLNLKPTGSMEEMKVDMGGSATVFGLIKACCELKLKKNVLGVVGSVENAIDSHSYKPGDVIVSHAGKSVEISNTDAEGRLVLADAFSYVQKHYSVSRIIDFATLTGAILVAIGEEAAGLFSNQDKLANQLLSAGDVTGERAWKMPVYTEYLEGLKSQIADLKNACLNRRAGACTAALFLQQFIEEDLPWAHLDIAGTAYVSKSSAYQPSRATGYGVKLMVEFLRGM